MAHKTLIGGTAYKVSGGKILVNGTDYKISKGRTLVGGTGYNITFGIPVTITGKGTTSQGAQRCGVGIGGTGYYSSASGIEVSPGDIIRLTIWRTSGSTKTATITINGSQVQKLSSSGSRYYEWTVPDGISGITIKLAISGDAGQITVTTT